MAKIENPKNYSGRDLETIFFRPMLSGPDARALGIKVMYNTPVPTTLQFWKRAGDILQKYTAAGWKGGDAATKYSKQIALSKVKAEAGYSAEDYFNMVYELITGRPDVNLDDLTGTELEAAETALFKEAIAESIRATMWLGDTEREGALSTFDGFLKRLLADTGDTENDVRCTGFDRSLCSFSSHLFRLSVIISAHRFFAGPPRLCRPSDRHSRRLCSGRSPSPETHRSS